MMKTAIFWAVVGIAFYKLWTDIIHRFSESNDKSIFNARHVIEETDHVVQNYCITKVINRLIEFLTCHIQIMETLQLNAYVVYWLVHKCIIAYYVHSKGWTHIAQAQTGVILCITTFYIICISSDVTFDITYIDFNSTTMWYFALEIGLSFCLNTVVQHITEYHYNNLLSINVYNYVFFSNLSYTMILLCGHCIGMVLFDLNVNDYRSQIANVTEVLRYMGKLQKNIAEIQTSITSKLSEESVKQISLDIESERLKFNEAQKSFDDTIMHIRFMLVLFHLATMFLLLSTYFTRQNSSVATQKSVLKVKFEPVFIADPPAPVAAGAPAAGAAPAPAAPAAPAPAPAAGAAAVGNNGVQVEEEKKIKLWEVEPYHYVTCIKTTLISTLLHMGLFVVTILISPHAHHSYLICMSVAITILKVALHGIIPSSKGNVCYMDPKDIQICVTPEGKQSVGIMIVAQNIMCFYFMPWMYYRILLVAQSVFAPAMYFLIVYCFKNLDAAAARLAARP
jgi:hypothetical protein